MSRTLDIDRTFVSQARRRAQNEAWMWRYHSTDPRPGWHNYAACRGLGVDWFYGAEGTSEKTPATVLALCHKCRVRLDCGAALAREEDNNGLTIHGVRAGMHARTREHLYVHLRRLGVR